MRKRLTGTVALILAVLIFTATLSACNASGRIAESSTETPDTVETTALDDKLSETSVEDERDGEAEKDEEYITIDEKWGRIAEGMLGHIGTAVKEYSGYLGYGYNMITSAYYNHRDINEGHPVIDMNKLAQDDGNYVYVFHQEARFSQPKTYVHDSTKSYAEELSAKAGVRGSFPLAGSFSVNFERNTDYQMTSNQRLVTLQSNLETRKDYISFASPKLLAAYLTAEFKDDLSALKADASDLSVARFIAKYGTHVLTNVTMGGRFDLNYLYTNKTSKEITDLRVAIDASYKRISTGSETQNKTAREELETSSELYITAYGGSVTINPKSIEEAINSYPVWSASVEEGHASFVDASEVFPIWDVIEAAYNAASEEEKKLYERKAEIVKAYILKETEAINRTFKDTKGVSLPPVYISDIYIGVGSGEAEAKNKLRAKGVKENDIVNLDLNKDAGGKWIFLGYTKTGDANQAIRFIAADYFKESRSKNTTYRGFDMTILKEDLNTGAGGKYIYLYYTKNKSAGAPLTEIIYQEGDRFDKNLKNADAYKPVLCMYNDEPMDFNKGAEGAFVYLWYK